MNDLASVLIEVPSMLSYRRASPTGRAEFWYAYRSERASRTDPKPQPNTQPVLNHGIYDFRTIRLYAKALDYAVRRYARVFPGIVAGKPLPKIVVYVCELPPDLDGLSLAPEPPRRPEVQIFLPRRFCDPAGPLLKKRMRAIVAHEVFHALHFLWRSPLRHAADQWQSSYDALATAAEYLCYPNINDFIRFLYYWFDSSETAFSAASSTLDCGGAILLLYLQRRFGDGVLENMVVQSDPAMARRPFDVLSEYLSRRGSTFLSAVQPDLFGSEFWPANYFLTAADYGRRLAARLAKRLQHVFVQQVINVLPAHAEGTLYPLGASCYLLRTPAGSRDIHLSLSAQPHSSVSLPGPPLKLVVTPTQPARARRHPWELYLQSSPGQSAFSGQGNLPASPARELLLTVVYACPPSLPVDQTQAVAYEFEVQ